MSKYYLDYENFATRNQRLIRAYATSDDKMLTRSSKRGDIYDDQAISRMNFLEKNGLPRDTKLKGDIGSPRDIYRLALSRNSKNDKLGLGYVGHTTWGERKAARIARNNKDAMRNHILKNAAIK